jgi:hypothetical protein
MASGNTIARALREGMLRGKGACTRDCIGIGLCFPKIHLPNLGGLAAIRPCNVAARARRQVLGVQGGQDERGRERCGTEEAIQRAPTVTQRAAFHPGQSRAGRFFCQMEPPIVAHRPGHWARLPSMAASRQPCNVRHHRDPTGLEGATMHPPHGLLLPPEPIHEDGRCDQTIIAGRRVGFPNAGAAATPTCPGRRSPRELPTDRRQDGT